MAFLSAQSHAAIPHLQQALFGTLRQLGYREGDNLIVERRFAEGRLERLPALAAELAALKPDVIFAGASQATLAASKATSTIPIVFAAVSDPVGMGVVKSFARPGTNATGLSAQNIEIQSKRLQLLREVFPAASRVTVLYNPLNLVEQRMLATIKETSVALKLALKALEIRSGDDLTAAFQALDRERPDVLYVTESPLSFMHRARIVELANSRRLPAVYGTEEFADAGGLIAYAFNVAEQYRGAAAFIDKILKGAKPAELPVQQPTRFDMVLNMKTAKAQGVSFPPAVLARADRVIE